MSRYKTRLREHPYEESYLDKFAEQDKQANACNLMVPVRHIYALLNTTLYGTSVRATRLFPF